jgi:putative transcriptional regulator
MPIIVNLDVMMAKRKISSGELAEKIGISPANLSILKTGKAKAIRFSTMEAICKALDCQPGDINEVNQRLISNGIVNLYNELEREKYMVGVLQAHDGEILYSFSIKTLEIV